MNIFGLKSVVLKFFTNFAGRNSIPEFKMSHNTLYSAFKN